MLGKLKLALLKYVQTLKICFFLINGLVLTKYIHLLGKPKVNVNRHELGKCTYEMHAYQRVDNPNYAHCNYMWYFGFLGFIASLDSRV